MLLAIVIAAVGVGITTALGIGVVRELRDTDTYIPENPTTKVIPSSEIVRLLREQRPSRKETKAVRS